MAKQIAITYKGVDYTLEFDRKIAKRMEEGGFVIDLDKPVSTITGLFKGAFQMHHRKIQPDLVEEIWDAQRNKEGLLTALVTMYTETASSLIDEDEGASDENPTWKTV